MNKYTIVAEHWDNEQIVVHHIEADNLEDGIAELQTMTIVEENEQDVLDDPHEIDDPLKILAVFEGHLIDLYP